MASIRRTLSPANQDRSYHLNGSSSHSPLSSSFSHKQINQTFFIKLRRFLTSFFLLRNRHFFSRCFLFFCVGIFLGIISPFSNDTFILDNDDLNKPPLDFSFNSIPLPQQQQQQQQQQQRTENLVAKVSDVNVNVDVVLAASKMKFDYKPRKLLIIVTPTYNRVLQGYYLNRLSQVLRLVNPPVVWIVVEMNGQSAETAGILRNSGVVMYRHLVCSKNLTDIKDRGVHQRNTAIEHIRIHKLDGIVYFADDDNIYSLELFERIRAISRFGTWPVAMLAPSKNKAILEGPVCNGSKVIGWHTNEKSKRLRRFHVDMSGFAFNSTILWDPKRWNRPFLDPIRQLDTVKEGFQETTFIEQVVADESQMEGIPDGCGKILNWHLHLDARGVAYPRGWLLQRNLDAVVSID